MPTDLTITLEDRPGTLADAAEALGNAGVNIEGGCGFVVDGRGTFHLLVEDPSAARSALQGAGARVEGEREVLVVGIENKPGALGEIARRVANAGANIDLGYLTADGRLVLGVDDTEKARGAI